MEELSAVLGLVKEGASILVMAWLVLRSRKGMGGEDPGAHQHRIREELLTELAELPGLAKALMHVPEASKDGKQNARNGDLDAQSGAARTESWDPAAAGSGQG